MQPPPVFSTELVQVCICSMMSSPFSSLESSVVAVIFQSANASRQIRIFRFFVSYSIFAFTFTCFGWKLFWWQGVFSTARERMFKGPTWNAYPSFAYARKESVNNQMLQLKFKRARERVFSCCAFPPPVFSFPRRVPTVDLHGWKSVSLPSQSRNDVKSNKIMSWLLLI